MGNFDFDKMNKLLRFDEGLRLNLYRDTKGKVTIGIGRNIEDNGISIDEANLMCKNDIEYAVRKASTLSYFHDLDDVRKAVLVNMIFNLGFKGFKGFINLNRCLKVKDYANAAKEILDSDAGRELKTRYNRLAEMMKTGEWPSFIS